MYTNMTELPIENRIAKLGVAPQGWDSNHMYGTGLIGRGLVKKNLRPKLGELPSYSAYQPAT